MMKLEILEEFSGSNDQMIVKRKRTKRPRPSSSTSSNGGGCGGGYYNSLVSSPTTSSGISTTTEEDEDMANCLILLARGNSPPQLQETKPTAAAAAEEENKISSRKFTEMAATTDGKVGSYVYECKTCNRTFSSFQALGGHRASHKKPKTTTDEDHNSSLTAAAAAAPDNQEKGKFPQTPSTQLVSRICNNDPNKPKIHECAICGSEFASGQALGGHMRRHRPAPSTSTRIGTKDNDTSSHDVGEKPRNMFALDLNLPALPEDDSFQQFPAKQQPSLVFSAAALVDCHY